MKQGGHIPAKIKFPVFSLSFPCVTNFFPVFFSLKKITDVFLINEGFTRLVITVVIIYRSTHAKKLVKSSMNFS